MPTRLLLEGNDIQQLLARVRAEHGPAAKIVSADRVRAAGVGGLFTRHRFELTIEVADGSVIDAPGLPSAANGTAANGTAATVTSATAAVTKTTTTTTTASVTSPADALVALVEAQERELLPYVGPDESSSADDAMQAAQEVSAGAAAFADVLAGYGAPAWRVPLVSGDAPTAPEPAEPTAAAPVAAPPVTTPPAIAAPPVTVPPVTTPPIAAPAAIKPPAIKPPVATTPAAPATPDAPLIPRYQPVRLAADAPLPNVLTHLGLPAQLGERVTGVDSYREIVRVLKLLPQAPKAPKRAGEVLVIVGELRGALEVARTVSESLRLAPSRVLLAAASCAGTGIHSSRRLTGPEQAARRVAKLRRHADMPLVVIVDIATDGTGTGTGTEWARSIVESFDPTAVWGVVDATRKTADSGGWLADIGRVDAIAAHGCAATGDPATVLQLGVPVAMIDGRLATPHIWAELLCRRLEEVVE